MGIQFPISPAHGQQFTPVGIPITWQFDSGRNAWRIVRGGPNWTEIVGKPTEFPPASHNHPVGDITGLQSSLDGKQDISARAMPNGYPSLDGDGRVPSNQLPFGLTGDWDDLTNKPTEFPPEPHSHPVVQISDSGSTGQQLVRTGTAADARAVIGAIGIDDNARVSVDRNSSLIGVRRNINFIEGSNVTLNVVDNAAQEEVQVTISAASGAAGAARYTVSETKPAAPFDNDIWFDAATGLIFTYYNDGDSSQWVESIPFLATMPTVFTKLDFPAAPVADQVYNPFPGASWKWSATRGVWFAVTTVSDSYTKAEADAKFVDTAGDAMSGPLGVVHPPTANAHAASKQYVDGQDSLKVAKAGDTMTGHLSLPTGPAAANAVRKDYVDTADALKADKTYVDTQDALKVAKAGDTMTGDLTINKAIPTINLKKTAAGQNNAIAGYNNATARWVILLGDSAAEGGADAGSDFAVQAFDDSGAYKHQVLNINRAAGLIQVKGDPTAALGVATKQYVDGKVVAATYAEYIANSAPTKMLTSGAVWTAAAQIGNVTDAAAVTLDFGAAIDFYWVIGAAGRTLNNPTAQKAGQKGIILLQQGVASATITSWGSNWKFPGGVKPTLSTASGAQDAISYWVVTPGVIFCTLSADFK